MTSQGRVVRACVRCRKQKLKCDAARPCTLCQRSGIHCEPRDVVPTVAKPPKKRRRQTLHQHSTSPSPPELQHENNSAVQATSPTGVVLPPPRSPVDVDAFRSPTVFSEVSQSTSASSATAERQHFGANSSAVGFAARLFGDSAALYSSSDIASIPGHVGRTLGGLATAAAAVTVAEEANGCDGQAAAAGASASWWSLATMRAPPPFVVVEALLDAYFDRMQWFINIFHEPTLRQTAQRVLLSPPYRWQRSEMGAVLTTLAVSALSLQCVASDALWPGHALLAAEMPEMDAVALRDALVQEVRAHLLDLLDDCCIETVQVCSLLGTYYIFHASPTLAWSILGMSVRTAYALALHCDSSSDDQGGVNQKNNDSGFDPVMAQVRSRNWNHITVADTFAAMIYGRPASLDAAFSHVQPLVDLDDTRLDPGLSDHPLLASASPGPPPPITQLTYHVLKFRLYGVIRQALNRFRLLRLQNPISPKDLTSLLQAVQYARAQLDAWRADLPPLFAIDEPSAAPASAEFATSATAATATAVLGEDNTGPTGPTGPDVAVQLAELARIPDLSPEEQAARRHLSLQILTLHATYDSAIIFVHRPLLEYRVSAADARQNARQYAVDVVEQSLILSVQAALRMSQVPVALLERQFVISFVLMNLFTAGVILCIPPTTWPLSTIAHKAKVGTMQIIRASRSLKHVSPIAMHTEKLLTRLLKRSLQQELDNGLQQEFSNEARDDFGGELGGQFRMEKEDAGRSNQERNLFLQQYQNRPRQQQHHRESSPCDQHSDAPQAPAQRFPQQQQQQKQQTVQQPPNIPLESLLTNRTVPPVSTTVEHPPATIATTPPPFLLGQNANACTADGEDVHLDPSATYTGATIYPDAQLSTMTASAADFRRPPAMGYYYAEQRQQVDSQLDEAFGTFGQILFNLVPDDPYSAWNWGNGAL